MVIYMIGSYGSKIGKRADLRGTAHRNDLFGKKNRACQPPFEKIDAETAKPGIEKAKTYHLLGAVAFRKPLCFRKCIRLFFSER